MFEADEVQQPEAPSRAAAVLDASKVSEWKDALAAALDDISGLDDAGRVDSMRALEELACVSTAAQAQLARELDASQRAAHAAVDVPAAKRGQGVAQQVALARRESAHRGQRHVGLARVVSAELAREIVVGACTGDEGCGCVGSTTVRPRASSSRWTRNAQGLCEACNYAKGAPGWRSRPRPDGIIETTTPTGHTYLTRPPPVATIRRRFLPRLTIDYVLAG